jgi:uncharacterized protein (TIGR02466 family)
MNIDIIMNNELPFKIEYLFPTPIYASSNVAEDILDELKERSLELFEEHGSLKSSWLHVNSLHQTIPPQKIKNDPIFSKLIKIIECHLKQYSDSLGITQKIKLTNVWFNISDKGDFNFPHSHPGSTISGVFYIECLAENILSLYNNHYLVSNFLPSVNSNEMSYSMFNVPCKKGNLLMWPAHIIHGNPRQESDGLKIALSFNTVAVYDD